MATYDFKVTAEYVGALKWRVRVFRREILVGRERGCWECTFAGEYATLEGHIPANERLRQVLRSLAA